MKLADEISKWKNKKVLVIGNALVDKYIIGNADSISPDAPVPNIKIEKVSTYIGAIGLVLKYIKSLGGIPEVCTILGNDYEGNFFLNKIKELHLDSSGIIVDDHISTPQVTRVKAMDQHVLRLETDYVSEISEKLVNNFFEVIETRSSDIGSILILDYGTGSLFEDIFIQELLYRLQVKYKNIPIIARPTKDNYYLYENVDLIRMNLQNALDTFSIDCCNETSISIIGMKLLNSSKCKNVLLNYLESDSYLISRDNEKLEKILPISNISVINAANIALFAAALTASLPPVEFYESQKLVNYISKKIV
jgi:rfaE bifunctional protein kinase chain/domain